MARKGPDEDAIRRYYFVHVRGNSHLNPLSEAERQWVELNVEHHPRWRSFYTALVRNSHRSSLPRRRHVWMQLSLLVVLLIPLGLDIVDRANDDLRTTVDAAREALVGVNETTRVTGVPSFLVAAENDKKKLAGTWKAALLAPDPEAVALLWRGLMSKYNAVADSAVKAETAFLLAGLAEAFGDTTAAVVWYRRTLQEDTAEFRTGAHARLKDISVHARTE